MSTTLRFFLFVAAFLLMVVAAVLIVGAVDAYLVSGGIGGPWGPLVMFAIGAGLLLAYLGAVAFVVAWAFRRGWNFRD